ncbi:hypothetical protein H2199_007324 [Coniosporium tulheliwenetii]|uniref:Uncharacterized protein n=1 Tax=Coniosporium tulheliwenetii TaxID=3383036 RepID=A0ACC2YQZ4_9PEZI|nr:hypothetical protein H2199_007324 [Cladosporium sp. JES 115]
MADPQPLPGPPTLPSAPTETLTRVLDTLFEPSQPLHTLSIPLLRSTPFPTYADLIAAIGVQLTDLLESASTSDTEWLDKILAAHPRLGEKKVESALSRGSRRLWVAGKVGRGKRVFVNGRSRQVIMEDMKKRIERDDIMAERREAIRAMCEIAADRAGKIGEEIYTS